jgi:hypothetical protein
MKKIFISHSSVDKDFVNQLLRRLQEHGLDDAWYDVREISATTNLPKAMAEAVSSAEYFAIVLSSSAAGSQWVSFEIQQALNANKPVLALMNAPASEGASLLANPFINQLLQGGQHKVLDFVASFEDAVLSLIREIAPDLGSELAVEERLRVIFEDEDPDVAERAMGFAAIDAAAHAVGNAKGFEAPAAPRRTTLLSHWRRTGPDPVSNPYCAARVARQADSAPAGACSRRGERPGGNTPDR